jgi:hypothetical protein
MATDSVISTISRLGSRAVLDDAALERPAEVGVTELPRGDVEADRNRETQLAPRDELLAALADDPGADRLDQPGVLGDRDEVQRRHEAALGVVPPQEGLDRHDVAGGQPEDRLEVQDELVALDRAAQPAGHQQLLQRVRRPAVGEDDPRAVGAPRLAHRGLGVAQQRLLVAGVAGQHARSDPGAQLELLAVDLQRLGGRGDDVPGGGLGEHVRVAVDVREQDGDLPVSEAGDERGVGHRGPHAVGDLAYHGRVGVAPQAGGDEIEAVEAGVQHDDTAVLLACARGGQAQVLEQQRARRQQRDRVARGVGRHEHAVGTRQPGVLDRGRQLVQARAVAFPRAPVGEVVLRRAPEQLGRRRAHVDRATLLDGEQDPGQVLDEVGQRVLVAGFASEPALIAQ